MAVWSEVKISEIQYTRIDSEYYKPHYLSEDIAWKSFSQKYDIRRLSKIISEPVRTGRTPRNRKINKDDNVIHFIKTNTLREGRIDYDNCDFIPENFLLPTDYISDDSVVVTIIGATHEIVGRAAIIRSVDPKRVTNQNVAIIKTNKFLNPYYLDAYLQTKMGRDQIWRHSRQTEQVNLNCREVERILIPSLPIPLQDEIGSLIKKSFVLLDGSQSLYAQAVQMLEAELGLDKLHFDKPLSYEARLSEVVGNNRADAEFYHAKFQPYLDLIKNYKNGCLPLSKLSNEIQPNIDIKKHTGFFDYIEISDVSINDGSYTQNRLNIKELPANAKIRLSGGEIIISQVRPTRGAISIISDELTYPTICSGAFYTCQVKEPLYREIIWLFLRSIRTIFEKYCGGTSYPTIDSHYLRKLPIPLFDKSLAEQIKSLILKSKLAKTESQNLLEQAKRRVEELIEQAVEK